MKSEPVTLPARSPAVTTASLSVSWGSIAASSFWISNVTGAGAGCLHRSDRMSRHAGPARVVRDPVAGPVSSAPHAGLDTHEPSPVQCRHAVAKTISAGEETRRGDKGAAAAFPRNVAAVNRQRIRHGSYGDERAARVMPKGCCSERIGVAPTSHAVRANKDGRRNAAGGNPQLHGVSILLRVRRS